MTNKHVIVPFPATMQADLTQADLLEPVMLARAALCWNNPQTDAEMSCKWLRHEDACVKFAQKMAA